MVIALVWSLICVFLFIVVLSVMELYNKGPRCKYCKRRLGRRSWSKEFCSEVHGELYRVLHMPAPLQMRPRPRKKRPAPPIPPARCDTWDHDCPDCESVPDVSDEVFEKYREVLLKEIEDDPRG